VRQLGQRDVPVPGVVTADLVLVQPGLGLGGLEALLPETISAVVALHFYATA